MRADVRVAVDWAAKRVEAYATQPFGLFATAKCLDQIAVAVLDVGDPSLGRLARAMRADSVALRVIDDAQMSGSPARIGCDTSPRPSFGTTTGQSFTTRGVGIEGRPLETNGLPPPGEGSRPEDFYSFGQVTSSVKPRTL